MRSRLCDWPQHGRMRVFSHRRIQNTYRALNAAFEITALETRQEEVGGVTSRHGGSTGQESDSVEAHIEEWE